MAWLPDLMAHAKIVLQTPHEKALCEDCGAIIEADSVHLCDIEERIAAGMSASWQMLLSGRKPQDRARGYSVR